MSFEGVGQIRAQKGEAVDAGVETWVGTAADDDGRL